MLWQRISLQPCVQSPFIERGAPDCDCPTQAQPRNIYSQQPLHLTLSAHAIGSSPSPGIQNAESTQRNVKHLYVKEMATTFLPSTLLDSLLRACGLVVALLAAPAHASSASEVDESQKTKMPIPFDILRLFRSVFSKARHGSAHMLSGRAGAWDLVQLIAFCSLIGGVSLWRIKRASQHGNMTSSSSGTERTDPGLLRKHTVFKSYTTSFGTYPSVRTFYRPHAQADKLPSVPQPIPLLVFIHGLGGSLAQFNPLLTSLVNIAPCLGIDLPGCGLSEFSPTAWECYTPAALAELLGQVVEEHCLGKEKQGVVFIAHSMGCSLSAMLASRKSSLRMKGNVDILGLVALCPRASPFSEQEKVIYNRVLRLPTAIFDIWRRWDRRGGTESKSVARFVGRDGDPGAKRLQERFNAQSRTPVWRRMAWGMLPEVDQGIRTAVNSGMPDLGLWATLDVPVLLIGGESDQVTKPEEVEKIGSVMRQSFEPGPDESLTDQRHNGDGGMRNGNIEVASTQSNNEGSEAAVIDDVLGRTGYSKNGRVVRTKILPAPASHALLYDPVTYRTVAGNIQPFLADHVDSRLSIGWQLTYLSTEGKWDVKNLKKWSDVQPVSEPIAGTFRAMKTLRQIDDNHSPSHFLRYWRGKIWAVLDISHDSPVYDPKEFEEGGIEYHKLPTVSKIPPTPDETQEFIELVDRLRAEHKEKVEADNSLIGVHCHYGFNRTGFFICAYLIEKEGYDTEQALQEFKRNRPEGIKHEHFINTLFARYPQG